MAGDLVSAAISVVGKALAPLTDDLLKDWAASVKLGDNVRALELELLSVKAILEPAVGKETDNSALKELLLRLQDLGYDADDVLDELDYFRIQDKLDGTSDAASEHARGCVHNLALHVRHTAKTAVGKLIGLPACCSPAAAGKHFCFPCSSRNPTDEEPPKLRYSRVEASKRMQQIVEQLQHVRANVSSTIATIGSNWSSVPNMAQSRPITTSESIEPKLYGRDLIMNNIIHDITKGKHSAELLTVIPIVGSGGIGKTTLAQHIYHNEQVQEHFNVKVWTCVSLNFSANKLIEEIGKYIPKVDSESSTATAGELIGQRLKNKRFLLVLDDIWDCSSEDEWKRLLVPFRKTQVQGNIIIVTTRFPAQAQIMMQTIDHSISLQGLEHTEFKELFLAIVFGDDQSIINDYRFLLETGDKIVSRLKGSPLAAKTVGRLLKAQLDMVHWTRVLESKEWEQKHGKDDIMPALKLSYDYLPSQLQRCFYYCALFPQDYKFQQDELINFWIGLEILHSSHGENKRVEDIGLSHLIQLVNHGFFEKESLKDGSGCYIIHDLLHKLARNVSSHECLSIESSQVRSLQIPPSIRHLSISIDDTSVQSRLSLKNCLEDFNTLDKRLKVEKLRSLMLVGKHHGFFVKVFGELFREANALRVVFLSEVSYDIEALLQNFYDLVHLRYLRIQNAFLARTTVPNKISRFYHMMVLDAKHCNIIDLPSDTSNNLVKLRHFLVQNDRTHSSIVEVGKLESLQELRRFVVKQGQGFELRQIGHLVELGGSLCIADLENVQAKEEADEAKLMQKSHLHELTLCWNIYRPTKNSALEEHVLERLMPSSNLQKLSIVGHGGATCPSWLSMNLSIKSLESLRLEGVAWKTFPPIGELWLVNMPHEKISDNIIPNKRFEQLRRLELVQLPLLKRWAVHDPCQLFPFMEVIVIMSCSELVELSFSHSACCQQEKVAYCNLFPRLSQLAIIDCRQLLSFPPVPWTAAPCYIKIEGTGSPCLHSLVCEETYNSEYRLTVVGRNTPDSTFWNVLAFHNLTRLKELDMKICQPLPLHHLQTLSSLRTLNISYARNALPFAEGDSYVEYQFPVEWLHISPWIGSGKELTQLLTYFPKLLDLELQYCEKITGLGVRGQQATETSRPSSSAIEVDEAQIEQHQQLDARAEEEIAALAEGLLLLPPQLQKLHMDICPEFILVPNPLERGWIQGLNSLQWLHIHIHIHIPHGLLSSSLFSCPPFPSSLKHLYLEGAVSMETLDVSNLSSLTTLSVHRCGNLRSDGLFSLLSQGHLTKLWISETPNFFVDSEPSRVYEKQLHSCSSKLQELRIDDVAGVTATPIRSSLLFSSLITLEFYCDNVVEHFTEEQEALLFVNSLEKISFMDCFRLQRLPARLHRLLNLKILEIVSCDAIQMLPKEDGLPSSLEELFIYNCPQIRSLPKNWLPNSLQKLKIRRCPAIQSLPKVDDLPSSLQALYVESGRSMELRRQCHKLIGSIPIVNCDY
ncbi:unnamed protein product [Urochloa decumbens]|uniref:AAA+ ATPase domain-containing protein n=1 Tax=Urochloa decumbens TaxID=240449 RepID=A0ABC9GE71_9POAL